MGSVRSRYSLSRTFIISGSSRIRVSGFPPQNAHAVVFAFARMGRLQIEQTTLLLFLSMETSSLTSSRTKCTFSFPYASVNVAMRPTVFSFPNVSKYVRGEPLYAMSYPSCTILFVASRTSWSAHAGVVSIPVSQCICSLFNMGSFSAPGECKMRSMWRPVSKCMNPFRFARSSACVPFPAPGADIENDTMCDIGC